MLRRLTLLSLPLVLLGMVGPVSAWAANSPGWYLTRTQALPLADATNLGPLNPSTKMHISVALPLRNQSQLQSYIRDISTRGNALSGQSLTTAQFDQEFAPAASTVSTVESYLTGQGFTGLQASANSIYISATGTAAHVETAFHTTINQYIQRGSTVYANSTPAMVPASVRNFIIAVVGLNDIKMVLQPLAPDTSNTPGSYWAPGFQKAYDATPLSPASKTPIAIFAEGDLTQVVADLRTYEADSTDNGHLPQVPVTVVHVGVPSSDTAGLVEWDMDTQTSTGIAGAVKRLYLYDATSLTDGDVALEFNRFVTQDVAKAGSASFGECEYLAYLDGFMVANDEAMSEAAAQGQTVFASAGDSGGFCAVSGVTNGVPAGEPFVNYPASSPYVVAAGGTTLYTDSKGAYSEESAWAAGGGGPSYFEAQPYWQEGVAPPTGQSCVAQLPGCLGRDVPDVAMDADFLLSAANFYNNGAATANGGTSLASPLSLGSWARIETAHNDALGFAAPDLYASSGTAGFHDVALGDTGPYPATPGWDYATGNGSFDIAQMSKLITQGPAPIKHYPVPSPACTLFFDRSGDAQPVVSTGNIDSLDVLSGGLSTASSAKTITGVIRVGSLNDGPAGTPELGGTGDVWYLLFGYRGATYFLSATYDPSTAAAFSYSYGHIETLANGSSDYHPDGTAVGKTDTTHGLISISAPWSDFGPQVTPPVPHPVLGTNLMKVQAQTFEELGTAGTGGALEGADQAGGVANYPVGKNC